MRKVGEAFVHTTKVEVSLTHEDLHQALIAYVQASGLARLYPTTEVHVEFRHPDSPEDRLRVTFVTDHTKLPRDAASEQKK